MNSVFYWLWISHSTWLKYKILPRRLICKCWTNNFYWKLIYCILFELNEQMIMNMEMKRTCQKLLEKVTQGVVAGGKIRSPSLTNDLWLYSKFCGLYTFFLPPETQTSVMARDLGTRSLFSQQQWSTLFFFLKDQVSNMPNFAGYLSSVTTTPSHHYSKSSHRQYINKLVCLCSNKNFVYKNRQRTRLGQKAVHSQLPVYHDVPRAQCCPYRLVGRNNMGRGC